MLDQERAHAPLSEPAEPITISVDQTTRGGLYIVTQGDRSADQLCWGEMIEQVISLTHPNIRAERYRMMTPAERRVDEARRELKIAERELENEQSNAGFAF